ncbi:MAG TPA: hypothetical protein VNJ06_14190 [Gemmatimonadales bacterium]|nr:hypothetical protein [Gemmatimonadales bacterium]
MRIIGIDNMSPDQLKGEVAAGGRFVIYQYCISVVVVSFKRGSDIYFIRAEDNAVTKGLLFTLCSLVLGWWGIPWGPIWTIATIVTNLRGGRNVTAEVLRSLATPVPGVTPK